MTTTTPTLAELNAHDDPESLGLEMLGRDCHGNELWLHRQSGQAANRAVGNGNGGARWSGDIGGWGYDETLDALD